MSFKRKKIIQFIIYISVLIVIIINFIAYFHAYRFTHFIHENNTKSSIKSNSITKKIGILFFGVDNPRPKNNRFPTQKFQTLSLKSNKTIECWFIQTDNAKGTVILFHGYSGEKSALIDKSNEFIAQGYNTFLVDFMGSGGSEGNQTTIGFKEAIQVKTCFDYLIKNNEKNIYLFGTSLGAVAILKSIHDYKIYPKAIIIECPFGSMYQTVCARFKIMKIPSFPMATLLVFWGGLQNGFWGFGHNPTMYAKSINCPTLLLYGEKDEKVSRQEIDNIYANLSYKKVLKTYSLAGHEDYWIKYKKEWIKDVFEFIKMTKNDLQKYFFVIYRN